MKPKLWSREDSLKFYRSEEWAELKKRFKASLPRGGRKCVCCGATKSLQVDHIVPISIDPSKRLDITNLQILCLSCNRGKSNKDTTKIAGLSDQAKKEKAAKYKGEFYSKRWFSNKPSNIKTGKSNFRNGFF